METDELLRMGITALKAGRKKEAHRLLTQVVEQDERNEMAWLWLSGVADTDEKRRICLENVLAINPNNGLAQRGLTTLQKRGSSESGSIPDVAFPRDQARLRSARESGTGITFQPAREEPATNEILQQAVAAIKSGEKEKGKQLLVEALEQDESNEVAWLWMTRCVTDRDVKRECFDRVLVINPDNKHAVEGLKRLEVLSRAGASSPKRKKMTKQQTKLMLGLGGVVLVLACVGIVSIWWAINSGLLSLGSAASVAGETALAPSLASPPAIHQPGLTLAPSTATPVPTWTPIKPLPTPDVRAEIEAYLDELDPLLNTDSEMWDAWNDYYTSKNEGRGMTSLWCYSYGHTLDSEYRELETRQVRINNDIASLVPPRQLKHAHDMLVSALRHKLRYHWSTSAVVQRIDSSYGTPRS